jgi:hypothetical protein
MSRLRQYNPNNYGSSSSIHAEFENLVRYIVSGERGSLSYSEMFQKLFDENGDLAIGVEFAYDSDGLKARIGDGDWEVLAGPSDLRGNPGRDVGNIPLPVISVQTAYTATSGQTTFTYTHNSTDTLFVHKNGILLAPTVDYASNSVSSSFSLTTPCLAGDVITVYRVRGDAGIQISRTDTYVSAVSQAVFGVVYPSNAYQSQIYLNGILLSPTSDYVENPSTSSITLIDPAVSGDTLTKVFFSAIGSTEIPGLMLEGIYTDTATGLIPYSKINVADGQVPQAKINGLISHISTSAKISVGASTPVGPVSGNFWLDTSTAKAVLKIYDASQFVAIAPDTSLPTLRTADSGYAVYVNNTGTGYTYKPVDLSSLVPNSSLAVAGGVATLDGDGRLDSTQQPLVRTRDVIHHNVTGSVTNATTVIRRSFGEKFRIVGLSVKTTSGTCTVQLAVSGVAVGLSYSAASGANDQNLSTVIEVDTRVLSKTLDLIVTSAASAVDLQLAIVIERLN